MVKSIQRPNAAVQTTALTLHHHTLTSWIGATRMVHLVAWVPMTVGTDCITHNSPMSTHMNAAIALSHVEKPDQGWVFLYLSSE